MKKIILGGIVGIVLGILIGYLLFGGCKVIEDDNGDDEEVLTELECQEACSDFEGTEGGCSYDDLGIKDPRVGSCEVRNGRPVGCYCMYPQPT